MRMRGVNFGGWFSQIDAIREKDPDSFPGEAEHMATFLGPSDFRRVKDWGFDHVRLPVDWFTAFDADLAPRKEALALLDGAVDGLLAEGLDVILDLHKCPGHDFYEGLSRPQAFFADPLVREDCLKVWSVLADRFGDRDGVLLELLNEPVAPDPATWNAVKDELASRIRRAAPRATLVVGSNLWNNASEFAHLTPIRDDNVLYSFHLYNPVVFTHQRAPWLTESVFARAREYPGTYDLPAGASGNLPVDSGRWDRERLERLMEPVFEFRRRHGARVACNEFGVFMGGASRECRLAWTTDVLDLLREHGIGWSYWNYKNLDFGIMSVGEGLFAASPNYDDPERVDRELVELLRSR